MWFHEAVVVIAAVFTIGPKIAMPLEIVVGASRFDGKGKY